MLLYRFFTKAGLPLRVTSLSDNKSITSVKKLQEKEVTSRSPRRPIRYNDRRKDIDRKVRSRKRNCKRCSALLSSARVVYSQVSRPPNLNPPIFLFTLVGANPPNLMPAKFSGYKVVKLLCVGEAGVIMDHSRVRRCPCRQVTTKWLDGEFWE